MKPRNYIYLLIILGLVASMSTVAAANYSPKNVKITPDYVTSTAFCSCGLSGWHYHTATFKNYCPLCHHSGTLKFNPKHTGEGEWTCYKCGADYCAADGRDKSYQRRAFLSVYKPAPAPVIAQATTKKQIVYYGHVYGIDVMFLEKLRAEM